MTNKLLLSIVLIIRFSSFIMAQEPDIEHLLEQQSDYSDISDLMEMLEELEQNPIDLNKATAEQLAALPWLSNILAREIINYRDQTGSFNSLDELILIENMNPELITILRKYITVSPQKASRNLAITTKTRLSRKLAPAENFKDSIFAQSALKAYNRISLNYGNHLHAGLLLEKDSGEQRIDDLGLYSLSYHNISNQNKLILGHYRFEFAQGLVFGNPYGYYKGNDPIFPAKRQGSKLLDYTLVDENASLYGLSCQFCFKIYQFFLFFSATQLDASLNDDGTVKNFYTTGYHRNAKELDKKDRLNEQLIGSRVLIKPFSNFSVGTTYYRSVFNRAIANQDKDLYRFAFKGTINELVGIDYNLTQGRFNLFGELARSTNSGFGLLTGLLMQSQRLELVILGRNYSKDFNSFHGGSFGERGDNPQNEQGIYFGFQLQPMKNWKVGIYFDQFKFPWRTYYTPMPTTGKELLIRAEHKALKNLLLTIQLKLDQTEPYLREVKQIIPRNLHRLRMQLDLRAAKYINLRCRMEKKWVNYQPYKQLPSGYRRYFEGILLYQDVIVKLNPNFDIAARLTLFDTDDYESRLYQFEHDVPGMLTNQMLYDTGTRGYLRMQWKLKRVLKISFKYGSTQYHYLKPIGSKSYLKPEKILNSISLQIETNW